MPQKLQIDVENQKTNSLYQKAKRGDFAKKISVVCWQKTELKFLVKV